MDYEISITLEGNWADMSWQYEVFYKSVSVAKGKKMLRSSAVRVGKRAARQHAKGKLPYEPKGEETFDYRVKL